MQHQFSCHYDCVQVEIALGETKLKYSRFEVDLQNKPGWYAPKINPASKVSIIRLYRAAYALKNQVPAITYGGPVVSPNEPSPESHKIAESLVLLDFVADISNSLLPKDPVLRAKARFFMNAVSNFVTTYHSVVLSGEPVDKLLANLISLQALLPAEGFAIGPEFTIADASIAPFLARMELLLKNDVGAYDEGTGYAAWQTFRTDKKYARINKYLEDNKGRESFKATFEEVRYSLSFKLY